MTCMDTANGLKVELAAYMKALPTLLGQIGKFVLFKGEENIGVFDTYEEALKAGYERFGLTPFLVKRISPTEQVAFITRMAVACPA